MGITKRIDFRLIYFENKNLKKDTTFAHLFLGKT